ncbi:serine/threonine-protein kinase [Acanthopleuribacter pedis]|uniref:Serine/threonine protein kinase n=1 Tax=Acanthopleuribacter pedis TaxID=442870 RepID=A0A8J7QCS4_9BACT|nr:serine/threonine-protein kinase [Acanthopleuribacter pedis]MBO1317319.1 serine/threonine protein kinase [Acanthopleuribacter pedis]MBO1318626.1 serine/threonine protein kinase [Acanthopleuribacter pedis]
MDWDQFERIDAVFQQVCDLPKDEQAKAVNRLCGDDPKMLRAVCAMLRSDANAAEQDFLLAKTNPAVGEDDRRVGPYQIGALLGEGGCGVVYLADQTEPVERRVALKIIKPGMNTHLVLKRFNQEKQMLANMSHPYIAQLYDAGVTASGRPYFAMEYIQGESLTAFCDEHQFTPGRRLDLFVQICEAVRYSHQKGAIHRDLKPANILVQQTEDVVVPKIIDFGIAKSLLTPMPPEAASPHNQNPETMVGSAIGTLGYMSPEQTQHQNQDIDVRADIYSLGVILFELMTGSLPIPVATLRQQPWQEALVLIREQAAPPASTRLAGWQRDKQREAARRRGTQPRALIAYLKQDIDWIIAKALAKNRDQRYAGVSDLLADIHAFRGFRPIEAAPDSRAYRVRKWLQRNRVLFATTGAVMAALVAGTAMAVNGLVQARQSQATAVQEATRAKHSLALLEDFLTSVEPGERGYETRLLDLLDSFRVRLREEDSIDPLTQAHVYHVMGRSYTKLGQFEPARACLENAQRIRSNALGADHLDSLESQLLLANLDRVTGNPAAAEAVHRALYKQLVDGQGARHPLALRALSELALDRHASGNPQEALAKMVQVVTLRTEVLGAENEATQNAMDSQAVLLTDLGRHGEAEEIHRNILALRTKQFGSDHPKTLVSMHNLGRNLARQNRHDEAHDLLAEVVLRGAQVLGEDHPRNLNSTAQLGRSLLGLKRYAEAEALYRGLLPRQIKRVGEDHSLVLGTKNNLCLALWYQKRHGEAARLQEQIYRQKIKLLGPDHPSTLNSGNNLAYMLGAGGETEKAERLAREILAKMSARLGRDAKNVVEVAKTLVGILKRAGKHDEARAVTKAWIPQEDKPQP